MPVPARHASASAVLAAIGFLVLGCVLERRSDAEVMADPEAEPTELEMDLPPALDAADAARITVEVFREAVRVGDLSLALSLLDGDAILLDDLADGPESAPRTRGEVLLQLRRRHAGGLLLEVEASEVHLGGEVALVVSRLGLFRRQPGVEDEPIRTGEALETLVLVPAPEGWRILHVHRSVVSPR
jgi:ketosteroid isomerase-like protein